MEDSSSTNNTAIPDVHQPPSSTAINGYIASDNHKADNIGGSQTGFGCLRCRPACLQFLFGMRWFVFFMCVAAFCHSIIVNGLIGVTISTIERRFGLSSSKSAWIPATYEIAGAPALLVIGYLGSTLRRPVWIGAGLLMLGVGVGIYTVPHFAAPPYRYADSGDSSNLCVDTTVNTSTNDGYDALISMCMYLNCTVEGAI